MGSEMCIETDFVLNAGYVSDNDLTHVDITVTFA